MEEITASPIVVPLLFLLRCVLPLGVLILISYLLRRGGWIVGANHHEQEKNSERDAASGGNTYV
ncbi:MAG: hypothetical protein PVI81_02680 [Anaerolineales bacterium]|jgi:hypothetical protein